MLDEKDLSEIRKYLIRVLPELLREEPEIATTIEGILAQHFPRRDEFARLLEELTLLREEMGRRSTQMQQEMDRRFTQMQQEMGRRFEQVDRQFALLHDQMDKRFALLWEEMERRFEQTDQRLERLERTQLEIRRDVARLQHGQELILQRMDGQEAWLKFVTGTLQAEKGQTLEDMFATALRYGLKNPDIAPEKIQLRRKLVDTEGLAFKRGFVTEVDLIAENNKLTVFEVKATAKPSEVDMFALKVELVAAQNPDKEVRGVFISLAAPEDVRRCCSDHRLDLVD